MPQKPKGKVAGSGRKAGTPNRRTREVQEMLDSLNCNPIEGMVRIAEDESVELSLRARMYTELAQYVAPKRKAIEHSGPDDKPIPLVIIDGH